ncbi:MAG: hypothetical protein ABW188_13990 [Rhodococcus fascians]|uniref:hypothetical protein n=1 Tax=Nocardiaceae TaxID=85025 RepID=UPI00036D835B|nr:MULTISPECIES: hypothetical protein [Rhodococcus]OZE82250.1 hypothetical protein CH304_14535 [Rhodococcus sp. 15-649-1-2]
MRSTVGLLVATGVLFAVYPVLRPYSSDSGQAGADAFGSGLWVAAHVSAMLGFITLALAVRTMNVGAVAEVTTWVGVGLTLPYYGAETFALHVLGSDALSTGDLRLIDLAEPIRYGPTQTVMFGAGLILVAIGTVALARRVPGWQSALFASGFVLFLPQFFAPPWLRVAHGLLVLAGAAALAVHVAAGRDRQEISTTTGA